MKSRRSVLKVGGVVAVLGVVGAGAAGVVPGLSSLMGTARPRDLGVRYTQADYENGLAKIPGHTVSNPEYMCVTCDYRSSGSVPAEATFTQEEFTAQLDTLNSKKGPVKDWQVRFNDDGSVESSALVEYDMLRVPVYVKGRVDDYDTRRVDLNVENVEVDGIGLSRSRTQEATDLANEFVQDFFVRNPGLNVEQLDVGSGAVYFKGTFPEAMEGDPNVVPERLP
jgi:hypothetical protein